jgi:hypothetical protein
MNQIKQLAELNRKKSEEAQRQAPKLFTLPKVKSLPQVVHRKEETCSELQYLLPLLRDNAVRVIGKLEVVNTLKYGGEIIADKVGGIVTNLYKVTNEEGNIRIRIGKFKKGKFHYGKILVAC